MKLLLDTHALLWAVLSPERLSAAARTAVEDWDNQVFVSTVSAWEIAIKASLGKLDAPADIDVHIQRACERAPFTVLPVTMAHAFAVRDLPLHHRDPFDRLLLAQAARERLTLVSNDRQLKPYATALLW